MQFLYNMCTLLICLHFLCSRFYFACMVLKNALTRNTLNVNVLRTFGRQYVMSAVIWLTSGIWVFHWCRLADTDWRPKTDLVIMLVLTIFIYWIVWTSCTCHWSQVLFLQFYFSYDKKKSSAFSLLDDSGKSADRRLIVYWLY